jgi:expansin (peptidoglycan-binding protein)
MAFLHAHAARSVLRKKNRSVSRWPAIGIRAHRFPIAKALDRRDF